VSAAAIGFCWPKSGTLTTATCSTQKSGCGCHSDEPPGSATLVVILIALLEAHWRRRVANSTTHRTHCSDHADEKTRSKPCDA
jgi:MYXO-CTERM domain-containing protein